MKKAAKSEGSLVALLSKVSATSAGNHHFDPPSTGSVAGISIIIIIITRGMGLTRNGGTEPKGYKKPFSNDGRPNTGSCKR